MATKNQKLLFRSHWRFDDRGAGPWTRDSGRRAFMSGRVGTKHIRMHIAYALVVLITPYRAMRGGRMRGNSAPPTPAPTANVSQCPRRTRPNCYPPENTIPLAIPRLLTNHSDMYEMTGAYTNATTCVSHKPRTKV